MAFGNRRVPLESTVPNTHFSFEDGRKRNENDRVYQPENVGKTHATAAEMKSDFQNVRLCECVIRGKFITEHTTSV